MLDCRSSVLCRNPLVPGSPNCKLLLGFVARRKEARGRLQDALLTTAAERPGRSVVTAGSGDLGPSPVLPLRESGCVASSIRLGERQRRRVMPREEERLALVNHQLQVVAKLLRLLSHGPIFFFTSICAISMASRPPAVGRRRAALVGYFLAPPNRLPARLHPAMASTGDAAVAGAFSRSTPKRCSNLYLDDDSFPPTPTMVEPEFASARLRR